MSVEAAELTNDEWTRWQGQVVDGVFPLGRLLGHSAQSGVYLTKSRAAGRGQVAIKLIPASSGQPEPQLARWARAGQLSHPHLLPLLESGTCLLDGLPFLYVVMEYADQTLAQLLQRRAMTAEEAREMLLPLLDVLTVLHAQGLVQGGLKPANILVVGDQLKLASDTIGRTGGGTDRGDQDNSAAGDIWALGTTLLEALACRSPAMLAGQRDSAVVSPGFSPEFREVADRCLSRKPEDRPLVTDLVAWMRGEPLKPRTAAVQQPAAWRRPDAPPPDASPMVTLASHAALAPERPAPIAVRLRLPAAWRPVTLAAAAAMLTLGLIGVSVLKARRSLDTPTSGLTAAEGSQTSTPVAPAAAMAIAPVPAPAPQDSNQGDATPRLALHEQIPSVSRRAARTIHGHVKVAVRAEINSGGAVSRVSVDPGGRSRYFQKLAIQAAKKWTFPAPTASSSRRVTILFDFSRDGSTAHVVPVQD